jgi:hypothetical protein
MTARPQTKPQRARIQSPVVVAMLAGLVAISCGGGTDGGPARVEVPIGLTVHCETALDGGAIPGDGTWIDAALSEGACLLYRLDTVEAARYSVHVLIAAGGNVDVIVASTSDFVNLVSASNAFGADAEAASFESPSGGTYHIAIIARADTPEFSTRVVRNIAAPSGAEDCSNTIAGGELPIDGTGVDDYVFPGSCVLYSFAGSVDSVYRLALTFGSTETARAVIIARDRDTADPVDSYVFPEPATTRYFTTDATQDFYVLVVGELFDLGAYRLSIERGNAPIGLADICFTAADRGAAPAGWTEVTAGLGYRECHLYTMSVTADDIHFIGLRRLDAPAGSVTLRLATDAAFRAPVTTGSDTIEGQGVQSFTSAATQTIHLAVVNPILDTMFDYGLRVLSSAPAPSSLDFLCNRTTPGAALSVGGGAVAATAMQGECVRYPLAVQAGVTYSLTAAPQPGSVALFVAEDPDHARSLGSSGNFSGPQGLSFTAPATATVYVTVAGRVDDTSFTVEAVTTSTPPASLAGRCSVAVGSGALTVGGGAVAGFTPADHCDVYTFDGVAGTSYTVTVSGVDFSNPDITLARDASFSGIIGERTTTDGDAIVFTAPATQAFHLAVHSFQGVEYLIEVEVSPPPPAGMATACKSAKDGGTLTIGAPSTRDSAVADQCVLYSFSGTSGTDYTITVFTTSGDPSLRVASDAGFNDVLTTEARTGGETYSFTAAANQDFFLAVFPATAAGTDFEIFVTSP